MPRLTAHRLAIIVATTVGALALLVLGAGPALASGRVADETAMLKLINQARAARGLYAVRSCAVLRKAAVSHSADMVARDYFAHSSLSGAGVATRARQAGYDISGCSRWTVGEVIAWGSGSRGDPRAVFTAWMHSKLHRSIILGKSWRDVGIGCTGGTLRGVPGALVYTVDFGRRVQ